MGKLLTSIPNTTKQPGMFTPKGNAHHTDEYCLMRNCSMILRLVPRHAHPDFGTFGHGNQHDVHHPRHRHQ